MATYFDLYAKNKKAIPYTIWQFKYKVTNKISNRMRLKHKDPCRIMYKKEFINYLF